MLSRSDRKSQQLFYTITLVHCVLFTFIQTNQFLLNVAIEKTFRKIFIYYYSRKRKGHILYCAIISPFQKLMHPFFIYSLLFISLPQKYIISYFFTSQHVLCYVSLHFKSNLSAHESQKQIRLQKIYGTNYSCHIIPTY